MKMKIAWHQECLKNSNDYARDVESKLMRLKIESERLNKNVTFLSLQIQTAVERGLKEFDSERFMKKSIDK